MSSILGAAGSFADRFLLGYAIGAAAGPALEPFSQSLANDAWQLNQVKPPTIYTLVTGVARGQIDEPTARTWSHEQGFSDTAFDELIAGAHTAMAAGELMQSYRRGDLTQADFELGLKRHEIEPKWWPYIEKLKDVPLEPAEVAKAIHRGIMKSDGLLVATPPTTPGNVPQVPESNLDPVVEAEWSGVDSERLRIMVGNAGLPPGIVQMLELMNRGYITSDDFLRGVGESNLRNEWGPAMLNLARRLLTPHEYEELALRGWLTPAEADAGAALSGMSKTDADLLFKMLGRPINVHQIVTGLERGGKYGGDYEGVPEPFNKALRESNIRPEWGNLAYANRYSLPSAFVFRALLQANVITAAEGEQYFLDLGYPPVLAKQVADHYGQASGSTADPHVTKANSQLWTTLHRSYVAEETDDATATTTLGTLGVAAGAIPEVLALWQAERALIRKQLTPAQVKKAYRGAVVNPDTGTAWTRDDAMAALLDRGYSSSDATTFLEL
jgi:hypothetical protein